MKVKVIQMLIKFLSGPKAGQTTHAPTNQNTQLLIDAGLAEAVDPNSAEGKRLRFPDATGRPMQAKRGSHRWFSNRSPFNGKPQLMLVTPPPIEEALPYTGAAENAEAAFKATKYAIYLPIPPEILAGFASDWKAWLAEATARDNNPALRN